MKQNMERSREMRERVKAQAKQCYVNAFRGMPYAGDGAHYVEGYVITNVLRLPIEHAWIEQDGDIIDSTLIDEANEYFAGVRLTLGQLLSRLKRADYLPVTMQFRPADMRKLAEANRAAWLSVGIDIGAQFRLLKQLEGH